MGIKEGVYCDEHWVLYVNEESPNFTPKNNIALSVHYLKFKLKKGKKERKGHTLGEPWGEEPKPLGAGVGMGKAVENAEAPPSRTEPKSHLDLTLSVGGPYI